MLHALVENKDTVLTDNKAQQPQVLFTVRPSEAYPSKLH